MSCDEEYKNPQCKEYIEFLNNPNAKTPPSKIDNKFLNYKGEMLPKHNASYDQDYYDLQDRTKQVAINVLNELQCKLFEWQSNNFRKEDTGIEWMALGASEEVGEVCHVIQKSRQKIRKHQAGLDKNALELLSDGIADVCIYLIQLCSHAEISFAKALFDTAEDVMKRDWKHKKMDGISK